MPKMIKIGEVRVLNHFDLPWTQPGTIKYTKFGCSRGNETTEIRMQLYLEGYDEDCRYDGNSIINRLKIVGSVQLNFVDALIL